MEAIGFWPRGTEPCGRRRSGFGTPNGEDSTPCAQTSPGFLSCSAEPYDLPSAISVYCTVVLTVAVLFARFGSGVSARWLRSR